MIALLSLHKHRGWVVHERPTPLSRSILAAVVPHSNSRHLTYCVDPISCRLPHIRRRLPTVCDIILSPSYRRHTPVRTEQIDGLSATRCIDLDSLSIKFTTNFYCTQLYTFTDRYITITVLNFQLSLTAMSLSVYSTINSH